MEPVVNVDLSYRALKTQALISSVNFNTLAEHTLEVIMRQLSVICSDVYVQVENVLCFSEIDIFSSDSSCSHIVSQAHIYFMFFSSGCCVSHSLLTFLLFESVSAHVVKKHLSVGFTLSMQICVGKEYLNSRK